MENNHIKLGGNALAVLALSKFIKIKKDKQHLPLVRKLAYWIASIQKNNGEFAYFKKDYQTEKVCDFVSGYYPGEAIFALANLYSIDPNEQWIDVPEKAAIYMIEKNHNTPIKDLVHDHWLLYGLTQLYKLAPDPRYVTESMRISLAIVEHQIKKAPNPDWIGGYYESPRTTPTSIRIEGLCAAYELARITENNKMMDAISDCVRNAIKFMLQTQYTADTALYLKKPRKVLGGFRQSLTTFETRIDYVQHAISALLATHNIIGKNLFINNDELSRDDNINSSQSRNSNKKKLHSLKALD